MKKFTILIFITLFWSMALNAQTTVPPGNVSGIWTSANSPYQITGDITVVGTLNIQHGVTVEFVGDYEFTVYGVLTVNGTDFQPVLFKSNDADNHWQGIYFNSSGAGSELNYCIIESSHNSGVRISNSSPFLYDCIIRNNLAVEHGGGIKVSSGTLTMERCKIESNQTSSAYKYGGGVYVGSAANMIASNCLFDANFAGKYGGGFYCEQSNIITLSNCIILNNSTNGPASGGGGISMDRCLITLNNCLLTKNETGNLGGSAIRFGFQGHAVITNCVIANNTCPYKGVLNLVGSNSTANIKNTIIFLNSQSNINTSPGIATIEYSCIEGGFTGTGNIDTNPQFSSPDQDIYTLISPSSPCIDAGDPDSQHNDDCIPPSLGGIRNDMGLYGGPGICDWNITPSTPVVSATEKVYCDKVVVAWDKVSGALNYDVLRESTLLANITDTVYTDFDGNAIPDLYQVIARNTCCYSDPGLDFGSIKTEPSTPGPISGASSLTTGETETYTIAEVYLATSYDWEYNGIAEITGGNLSIELTPTTSGTLRVRAVNNCGESDWSEKYITVTGGPSNDDFYIQNESVNNTNIGPGQAIEFECNQCYSGTTPDNEMGDVEVGFYLSDDHLFDYTEDILLDDNASSLGSDDPCNFETDYASIPSNIPNGEYYILFVADHDNQFPEVNENNNVEYIQISVSGGSTNDDDFYVDDPEVNETSLLPGGYLSLGCKQCYSGSQTSNELGEVYVGFYLSADEFFNPSIDFSFGDRTSIIGIDDPCDEENKYSSIPLDTEPGSYYILFVADHNNAFPETNENNNVEAIQITVVNPLPDLVIQNQNASPTTVEAGGTIDLSCIVKNIGDGSAGTSDVGYILSDNTILSASDNLLGSSYVSSLVSGNTSNEDNTVTVPAGTTPGIYYIFFDADYQDNVIESNEDNNDEYIQINVTEEPYLSLTPSSLNFPATGGAQTFTVSSNSSEWWAMSMSSWLSFEPEYGSYNGTVTVTAEPNPNSSMRLAEINVWSDAWNANIYVHQEGTSSFTCGNSLISDYDGNSYNTVQIGNQCWLKENMKTIHFADGSAMIQGNGLPTSVLDGDYTTKYYFDINDNPSTSEVYGKMYTWAAVVNGQDGSNSVPSGIQGLCPSGWHVPSDNEWKILEKYLGMSDAQVDNTGWRGTDEGGKLKESGVEHWDEPNTGATNSSGLTILPSGDGVWGYFLMLGKRAYTWSSTNDGLISAFCRFLHYERSDIKRHSAVKDNHYTVRCLKDFPSLSYLSFSVNNVECYGQATGSINLSVYGGTAPYSYEWSNGATTQDLYNIPAGTYVVTVTDANGSFITESCTITQSSSALSLSFSSSNVSCNGGSNGSINLTPSGGTPPYTYLWNDGYTTQDRWNLSAGIYTVTLTDASCSTTGSQTITEPPVLAVGPINGEEDVCSGYEQTYYISSVPYAENYTWQYNGNGNPNSTGTSVTLSPTSSGTLKVRANNSCGSSNWSSKYITVTETPDQPTVFASDGTYCDRVFVSWNSVSGATSYDVYRGSTFLTSTSGTSYSDYNASTSSTTYKVYAGNSCGMGSAGTDNGYKNSSPGQPGAISGNANLISGTTETYTISTVPNTSTYEWEYEGDGSISGSGTSISLTPTSSGMLKVRAINTCGNSDWQEKYITVTAPPSYTITTTPNPPEGGTTTGDGTYMEGTEVTITAFEAQNWLFTNWTEAGIIISEETPYTFTIDDDRDFTANFIIDPLYTDSLALVEFYDSTNGPGWSDNAGWLTDPLSEWHGITVEDGRVTGINLHSNNLVGSLPEGLGNLSKLEFLSVSYNNQLTGSIPESLGNLSNLYSLYLYSNQLTGSIPESLGNLGNLYYLYLHSNQLTGSIPESLGNLSNLYNLYLYSNQLTGSIPESLGNLSNLVYLYLYSNQLTGSIPASLGNLSNLHNLDLYSNQLSGGIPESLGNLSKLEDMGLYSNQLNGGIPESLGNLSMLEYLDLSSNQLNGSIPESLGNLSNLTNMSLSYNQLTGSIPESLGNLSNLEDLYLNYNQLTGSIPESLGNLSNLEYLKLNSNQLSGSIPVSLGNLSSLLYLYLYENQLTGSIPASLGNLSNLYRLYLDNNLLEGQIPMSICNGLQSMNRLKLNNNNFSQESCAVIQCLIDRGGWQYSVFEHSPQNNGFTFMEGCESSLYSDSLALVELYNATDGENWYHNNNWLTGPLNDWYGITISGTRVTAIDLYNNDLVGIIPECLGDLNGLEVLEMDDNQLSGSIPESLGNLSFLTDLQLDNNQLSGAIPESLGNLLYMENIELDRNQLTGSIPASLGNLSSLNKLYLYNNLLEGEVPMSICTGLQSMNWLKLNYNNFGQESCAAIQCLIDRGGWSSFLHSPQNDDFDFIEDCIPPCENATAQAGDDVYICEGENVQLNGQAQNYFSILWQTTGDGTFADTTALQTTYYPGPNDIISGVVELCLTAFAEDPCEDAESCLMLEIIPLPFVEAGPDLSVCEGQTVTLDQSMVGNYSEVSWTSSGDGDFFNPNSPFTSYSPGAADLANGSVELTLTASAVNPCVGSASDEISVYFEETPTIDIGSDYTICEDETIMLTGLNLPGFECDLSINGYPFAGNIYIPTPGDIAAGYVEVCVVCEAPPPCSGEISDCLTVFIQQNPSVDAGVDQTIVAGIEAYLDATAENYSSLEWTTSGTGTFNEPTILNPVYNPTIQDFENGSVQLTVIANPQSPCMTSFSDNLTIYCEAQIIDLGLDDTVCENVETISLPWSVGQGYWSTYDMTYGDGTFDYTDPVPISLPWTVPYIPGPNDLANGFVEFCLTFYYSSPPGYSASDCKIFYFQDLPSVNAGEDLTILENQTTTLNATASSYSSLLWTTTGDGVFDDASLLNPVYTPGTGDVSTGSTELCLQAEPISPCMLNSSDCLELSILRNALYYDSLALVDLYNSTKLPGWLHNENWLTGPLNTWHGIIIENGRVSEVDLGSNYLVGSIPESLEDLTAITYLNLGYNALDGEIPNIFENFSDLQYLHLGYNFLNGSIPVSLGFCNNLQHLSLFQNQLNGNIPEVLCDLINLQYLSLSKNQLSGSIPSEIGNLDNLQTFHCYNNQLSGNIPDGLVNLNNLESLYLNNNQLSGSIPVAMCSGLTSINTLTLNNNNFGIEDCPGIQCMIDREGWTLFEHSPQNDGFVFMEDCGSSLYSDSLVLVALYNSTDGDNWTGHENWLTGPVSTWHGVVIEDGRVSEINLGYPGNNLVGVLPNEIGELNKLKHLHLSLNQISGTIPESIENLAELETLWLSTNQLSGSIPEGIGNLENLESIYFDNNQLEWPIPASMCTGLTNLHTLWVINNNFGIEDCPDIQCMIDREGWTLFEHSPQNDGFVFMEDCIPPCEDAIANAGDDATICEGENVQLNGVAENYESVLWHTTGDGTFADTTALQTTYYPGIGDNSIGNVELCLTAYAEEGCEDATDCMELIIVEQAVINLPEYDSLDCQHYDFSFYAWMPIPLNYNFGSYSSVQWSTSGDGYFDDPSMLNTQYNIGSIDIANSEVKLFLQATALSPCQNMVEDSITIHIPLQLISLDNIGWGGISSYLDLSEKSIPQVVEPIADCIEKMTNNNEQVFIPDSVNQIGNWVPEGYKIKTVCQSCLPLYGEQMEDLTYQITDSIVLLPVFSSSPFEIENLFAGHLDKIMMIYDWETNNIYKPGVASTLTHLLPGKAYALSSKSDVLPYTISFSEIRPPVMSFDPEFVTQTLVQGETMQKTINISNLGLGETTFSIDLEMGNGNTDEWIEINPVSGFLSAGEVQQIDLHLDASEIVYGSYSATISITTDDLTNPNIDIPVTINVLKRRTILFEPFEDYTVGNNLSEQAISLGYSHWTTWTNNPGSDEDPLVTDEIVFEGNNAVKIEGENDVVLLLDDNTEGKYNIDFYIYIATERYGYFNLLQDFNGPNSEWGMQVLFNSEGNGQIDAGGTAAALFTFNYNTWHHVTVLVDLDQDYAEMFFDETSLVDWQWSTGSQGYNSLNQLSAMNLFAYDNLGLPGASFDNISVERVVSHSIITDSLALVALYNATNGSGWTDHENWLTDPVSTWHGVVIEDGRVSEINLGYPGNNLVGVLPNEIGELNKLKHLHLSLNQISGTIPESIENLAELETLWLSTNQLSGSIPEGIGNLENLESIYFDNNQLEGPIPASMCTGLTNLNTLWIINNNFGIEDCPGIQCMIDREGWTLFEHSPQNDGFVFMEDCIPPCENATAFAGDDATICEGENFQLNGAAENYESVLWETSGDGTFADTTALQTTYYPGTEDNSIGNLELCLTANAEEGCEDTTACIVLTIVPLPTVDAGADISVCDNVSSISLNGSASNYAFVVWQTSGDGFFMDENSGNTEYIPGPGDLQSGLVDLCLKAYPIDPPCTTPVEDCLSLNFLPSPIVFAGSNATICEGDIFELGEAEAENYSSFEWTTSGDGSFSENSSINPVYTPGYEDIANGWVELNLEAFPLPGCNTSSNDAMNLTIVPPPYLELEEDIWLDCEKYDYSTDDWMPIALCPDGQNISAVQWTANGDGYFDDANDLCTNYTLGDFDKCGGEVELTIQAFGHGNCGVVAYQVTTLHVPGQLITIPYDGETGISSYIDKYSSSVPEVLDAVKLQLDSIYDASGRFYKPVSGINQIGNWKPEGYKARFTDQACLPVYGNRLTNQSFTVHGPETYLPVLTDVPVNIDDLMEGHLDDIFLIYCWQTGNIWIPEPGMTPLETLLPGRAYLLQTVEGAVPFEIQFPPYQYPCEGSPPDHYSISGHVTIAGNDTILPLENVSVQFTNIGAILSNASGHYSMDVPVGWSGTVTPSKDELTFEPASRNYSNLSWYKPEQDFLVMPNCPTANAGEDATICENGTNQLEGEAENYTAVLWHTTGDGTFADTTALQSTYYPGNQDLALGEAELCLTAFAEEGCEDAMDCITLSIIKNPTADAGPDQTLANGQAANLNASADNYSNIEWSTNGDGVFSSPNSLYTEYNPGTQDISSGSVELCISAEAISPCVGTVSDCLGLTILPDGEDHFQTVWENPFQPMNIYIYKATIDQINMVAGDEIGIFDIDPDTGEEICVGAGILTGELQNSSFLQIITSMDDGTGSTNGFQPGHTIIYKLWSSETGEVDQVIPIYPYPGYDEVFTLLGSAHVELEGFTLVTQTLGFSPNWNLISMNVVPDSLDMPNIFSPVIELDQLIKILDQDGNSFEHIPVPAPNGQWVNSIGNWTLEQGYYGKFTEATTLSVTAPPVEIPMEIPLRAAWNIIGMPCPVAQSTQEMLQPLINDGILKKVISEQGLTIEFIPVPLPNGHWNFGITSFEPGEGYYIKTNEAASLIFDCESPANSGDKSFRIEPDQFEYSYQNNPYMPMSIALTGFDELMPGDEIGIFDGEICVGAAVVTENEYLVFPVSMDDPTTELLDGFVQGNELRAEIWQQHNNNIFSVDLMYLDGVENFQPLETYIGEIKPLLTGINESPGFGMSVNIVPNPFNDHTWVYFNLPENGNLEIALFDLAGKKQLIVIQDNFIKGAGKVRLDSQGLQAGCYILKFTFSGNSAHKSINKKLIIR